MQILIRECKCGHNNFQHSIKLIEDFKWTKEASCNVCNCSDFTEKVPDKERGID